MKLFCSILIGFALLVAFALTTTHADPVKEGDKAPLIKATDHDGKEVDFGEIYKKGLTLVYFYPKADTPGCTKQACSLRDAFADLTQKKVTVIGVSTDKVADQKAFQEKFKLPFTLIADDKGEVVKAFGVPMMRIGLASRQCFLINQEGKIVYRNLKAPTDQQAAEILKYLETAK